MLNVGLLYPHILEGNHREKKDASCQILNHSLANPADRRWNIFFWPEKRKFL